MEELLDDFLDSPLEEEERIPLVQLEEGQIDPRFLRTSYSSTLMQHGCPRKYQLKCLGAERATNESSEITFSFGHVIGQGIQDILQGIPWVQVVWTAFTKMWAVDLMAENEKQKKSFFSAIHCLQQFHALVEGGFLGEYEVAVFDGKPAAELSFRIFFEHYIYRGHVDLVLRHKITGELLVLEIKTSSANYVQPSSYKNSSQAIGYSVILDKIEPDSTSYGVLYLVYLTKSERFETFEFPKTYHQRALWLRDRMVDEANLLYLIQEEGNYGIWPMHGESCNSFGRDCEYMDMCQMNTGSMTVPLNEKHFKDINRETGEEQEYQFEFSIGELLEAQMAKSEGEVIWEVPKGREDEFSGLLGNLDSL